MKIELVDICTFLVGFIAPMSLFRHVSDIGQILPCMVISIVCGYGSMKLMKDVTMQNTPKENKIVKTKNGGHVRRRTTRRRVTRK
jgi:hypothetical protein